MELQFERRECAYMRCNVRQVQNLEQAQEVRLPEGMPDIGRVLCAWGQGMLRSKEWRNDGMTVTGSMQISVLFAPEDGSEPRSMEISLPFVGKWSFPECKREGSMIVSVQVCEVDVRALSARKMMVRATAGVLAQAFEPTQTAVFTPGQGLSDVELLHRTYPAVLLREAGEKQFMVDEDLQLNTTPRKILSCQVDPVMTDKAAAGGRVVLRGECRVHLVYMDEADRMCSEDVMLPFAQLSQLDRDYDKDATAQVTMAVTNVDVHLNDGNAHLQCGLVAQYMIFDRYLLEVAEDAYSPFMPVQPTLEMLTLPMLLETHQEMLDTSVQLSASATSVVDVTSRMWQPAVYREGDTVTMEIPGNVQVLYYDMDGNLRCDCQNFTGRMQLEADAACQILPDILLQRTPLVMNLGDKLQIDGGADVQVCAVVRQELPMVTGLTLGERSIPDPRRPSLILQRMGDAGLWEMAKCCGSTVTAIEQANGLQGEPSVGQLLLIPVV